MASGPLLSRKADQEQLGLSAHGSGRHWRYLVVLRAGGLGCSWDGQQGARSRLLRSFPLTVLLPPCVSAPP